MKISKRRFLMTVLVGTGMCAVLLAAFRSGPKSSKSNEYQANLEDDRTSLQSNEFDVTPEVQTLQEIPIDRLVAELEDALSREETLFAEDELILEEAVADAGQTIDLEIEQDDQTPVVSPELVTDSQDPQWKINPYSRTSGKIVEERVVSIPVKAEELETDNAESMIETKVDLTTEASVTEYVQPQYAQPELAHPEYAQPEQARPVPMPPAATPGRVSDAALQKAVHHIEYGKSLARRNATEAAGQEFLGALRVLAESGDMATGTNDQTTAMRNGLLAIREASDFKVEDPQRQIIMNVAAIVEGHETQLIGQTEAQTMTASAATRRYLEYAGLQLGSCGGQNAAAAEALFCLGKMRSISAHSNPDPESIEMREAIIFHHAALTADPHNFRSANELGVLLARDGQLANAELYLKESLKIKQVPQSWANLAKVHQRKGTQYDMQLADLAMNEYQTSLHRQMIEAIPGAAIQWMEPGEFIARSPVQNPEATVTSTPQPAIAPVTNVEPEGKPSIVERIGSLFVPKNDRR
jgi:tetratricopeptide (TPR) repeat protein